MGQDTRAPFPRLGGAVTQELERLGISKAKAAEVTGIDRSLLKNIANGRYGAGRALLVKLAKGLGLPDGAAETWLACKQRDRAAWTGGDPASGPARTAAAAAPVLVYDAAARAGRAPKASGTSGASGVTPEAPPAWFLAFQAEVLSRLTRLEAAVANSAQQEPIRTAGSSKSE